MIDLEDTFFQVFIDLNSWTCIRIVRAQSCIKERLSAHKISFFASFPFFPIFSLSADSFLFFILGHYRDDEDIAGMEFFFFFLSFI